MSSLGFFQSSQRSYVRIYFDYLDGKEELATLYHGEYMAQYSFAELTNASLFAKLSPNQ